MLYLNWGNQELLEHMDRHTTVLQMGGIKYNKDYKILYFILVSVSCHSCTLLNLYTLRSL